MLDDLARGRFVSSYHVERDPGEKTDRGLALGDALATFRRVLANHKRRNDRQRRILGTPRHPVDEETLRKLRSLGYIK
jgi:hypothetical protein